ncbi:thiol:disulfide interchange protein DsbD [Dinoroseobacter shibae DFL 12 = DSM 16493]|uniref:Thiol:disulfide interchange protein DsbD n=1 Tax=Dinoroseobacter shibae (strain DSM 16493 / NCIMB 14021 / DFL 12) TaxID=398580 RepID=A8LP75_DINSH|nr:protein-disulfide reductase DsbD domain-containing protein [Dinoroseobacter shibae]ABV95140.1 thiol:disulfide interchange protein DsbD [Dinoroseobacter shibae DFL 12 = DSM 16493]URF46554.1 thioredoxin family protein [Dinoroseobacter shibae]URF50860.1 thioredoxin family protein [Dinoroseobacter shibae]
MTTLARCALHALALTCLWLAYALPGQAAESEPHVSAISTARLVTAEDAVAPNAQSISAALAITLEDSWKTYWRSPGEVGLPPEISWEGSENIASVELLYPAPTRFRAFGIENFGYADEVNFPLKVTLEDPGAPAKLSANVSILVCAEICVPEEFALDLDLGTGTGVDAASANLIASAAALVPEPADLYGVTLEAAALADDGAALVVAFSRRGGWQSPDIFPEMGEYTAFGAPDVRIDPEGDTMWARLPVLSDPVSSDMPLRLTLTDDGMAVDLPEVPLVSQVPAPPFEPQAEMTAVSELLWIALIAVIGGLILNVMPCVLPVLSIKFASALKAADQSAARVRGGFLMSAAGVLAFMWLLAAGTLGARAMGLSVGWGLQFQNPYFLTAMLLILTVFAANLAGLFEISLPQSWMTRMSSDKGSGYTGDFATGAFAAVLATPCSAPFLGTAIAFAMAGRPIDIVVIFTALGIGLALPYLLVAAAPGLVRYLPKPGRWMLLVKAVLAGLLILTAAWLLWVLGGVAGSAALLWVAALLAVLVLLLSPVARGVGRTRVGLVLATVIAAFFLPMSTSTPDTAMNAKLDAEWIAFERSDIPKRVAAGEIVFVDVTADWCLTCKANKALVLDREPVAGLLASEAVTAMRADWTRPDESISAYLESFGRFGIPFNVVYGPAAPEGLPLPELLTADIVQDALLRAGMNQIAQAD